MKRFVEFVGIRQTREENLPYFRAERGAFGGQTVPVEANGKKVDATLYEIISLSLTANHLWLDDEQRFFTSTNPWGGIARQGFQELTKKLTEAQQLVEQKRWAELATQFRHKPEGDLILKNVSVFDSITGIQK